MTVRTYLVTGAAGFIGFHLCRRLLEAGADVVGIDNFSSYYDVSLKEHRAAILGASDRFTMHRVDLEDRAAMTKIWREAAPEVVIHLAAQAGVRYSVEHPETYVSSNLVGTYHVLELCRAFPVRHLMAASTSSIYGANTKMPFSETDHARHPMTLYAATKGATELMGHSYSALFKIPMTFFRFFTVYGPWGRPDMALFKFTKAMLEDEPIDIYNNGDMLRDFTYIDDLVESLIRLIDIAPTTGSRISANDTLSPAAPHRIVNIGKGAPDKLLDFVEELERAIGKKAIRNYMPMQIGDVPATFASVDLLYDLTGYRPMTKVSQGVPDFVKLYNDYYSRQQK